LIQRQPDRIASRICIADIPPFANRMFQAKRGRTQKERGYHCWKGQPGNLDFRPGSARGILFAGGRGTSYGIRIRKTPCSDAICVAAAFHELHARFNVVLKCNPLFARRRL
jgi:hypothetical protein